MVKRGTMHINAQAAWHDPAFIVGNKAAMLALREALDRCLSTGKSQSAKVFAADGEGYSVIVCLASDEQMETVPLGYTDECCRDDRDWPRFMEEAYRKTLYG